MVDSIDMVDIQKTHMNMVDIIDMVDIQKTFGYLMLPADSSGSTRRTW